MKLQSSPRYSGKSTILTVLGLCAILIGFAFAKEFEVVSGELAKRVVGIMIGGVLIVTGNVLPKFVLPRNKRMMATERFAGWTFFLTGFILACVWMLAPIQHVQVVSSTIGLTAFALVFAAWIWSVRPDCAKGKFDHVSGSSASQFQRSLAGRNSVFLLIHAILWVFVIFLADSIWGDHVAQWLSVIFVIASGVLMARLVADEERDDTSKKHPVS